MLIIGLVLLSIKPSFGISLFLFCLLEKKYIEFIISSIIVFIIFLFCSLFLDESPFDIIFQTLLVMKNNFSIHEIYHFYDTVGIFIFLKPIFDLSIISYFSFFLFMSISILIFTYSKLKTNIETIHLSLYFLISPIVFFYNHTHSWITSFPLILLSLALFLTYNKKIFFYTFLFSSLLIIIPKLYLFSSLLMVTSKNFIDTYKQFIDIYLYIHNLLRMGSWLVLSFLIPYLWLKVKKENAA